MTTPSQATVLYVDDEAMALKYFERLISPSFKVITAMSVDEGIAALKAHGKKITVLISDQRMPGANGNELLRHARHHYPHIVRLLTTAYSELGEAIVAINSGEIYRYITKPWDAQMLMNEVRLAAEVSELRNERDELVHAKIQVQQAQLLANRVNNLALAVGLEAKPSAALQQYIDIAKQLGGVALEVEWSNLHYSDWMHSEAVRHSIVQKHVKSWLTTWQSPSLSDLMTALGEQAFNTANKEHTFKGLLIHSGYLPTLQDCAWLAWLVAVHCTSQHRVRVESLPDGTASVSFVPYAQDPYPALAHDWLTSAMEDLSIITKSD
jgi:two-component system, probable response regulator PhcQ